MIEDAIRSFLWGICKLGLIVADWVYDMINEFITLDISSNTMIWYIFGFGLLFLTFACFIRLTFVIARQSSNDDEQLEVGKIGKRIVSMFVVITVIPALFTFSLQVPSAINSIFTTNITMGEEMTPSTSVLTAIAKTPLVSNISDMIDNDELVTIEVVDESLNDEKSSEYVYFAGYGELFFTILMGFLLAFSLVNVFTQIVERWFIQLFRLFIGFIPISSMVDPSDNTAFDWGKDILSDVLVQTYTLISLWAIFAIMGLDSVTSLNGIVRLFMFWIGISAISKIGDLIAKYIGATNLAKGNKVGSAIATLGMYGLAKGSTNLGKSALQSAGNVLGGIGAGAIQKTGQSLGGKSMQDMGFNDMSSTGPIATSGMNLSGSKTGSFNAQKEAPLNNPLEREMSGTRMTYENTPARAFSDVAQNMGGTKGLIAKGVSNASSHIYSSASNRYNNTALRRAKNIVSTPSINGAGATHSANKGIKL